MTLDPTNPPPDPRPAGNQFSLRGMFIFMTAVSVILALLALSIKQPVQWLGTLAIIAFCLTLIGLMELFRKLIPSPPPRPYRSYPREWPAPPQNQVHTIDRGDRDYPFGESPFREESPFAPSQPPADQSPPAGT
jgi:hypothetical protein